MTENNLKIRIAEIRKKAESDRNSCKSSETSRCYFDGYIMALLDVQAEMIIPDEILQRNCESIYESQDKNFDEGPEMDL